MSSNKPKKAPTGDYAVGYARPPKPTQFQPGQSGNSAGRPRGRQSLDELLLEEAARSSNSRPATRLCTWTATAR